MSLNKFAAAFILGAAAGAAATLFLKSEQGEEIMSDIKDAAKDAGTNLKSKLGSFEQQFNDLLDKGKQFVADLEKKAKNAASSV